MGIGNKEALSFKRRWHAQLFLVDGVHLFRPELIIHKDAGHARALGLKLAELTALRMELDEGEAEALALAKELAANLLLLDERRGRAVAWRLDLWFIGVLGVLIEAKQRGRLPTIKPVLDELVTKAGFSVSPQLYSRVLPTAGE